MCSWASYSPTLRVMLKALQGSFQVSRPVSRRHMRHVCPALMLLCLCCTVCHGASPCQGRCIMWAWLCELPTTNHTADYAGSICLPRVLTRGPDGTLLQQPLPELKQLATGPAWHADSLMLQPGTIRYYQRQGSTQRLCRGHWLGCILTHCSTRIHNPVL